MSDEGTGNRQKSRDFSQSELHRTYDAANSRVTQKRTERATSLDRATESEEKSRSNSTSNGYHLDVALAETSSEVVVLELSNEVALMVVMPAP